jgi:hypothetical protein
MLLLRAHSEKEERKDGDGVGISLWKILCKMSSLKCEWVGVRTSRGIILLSFHASHLTSDVKRQLSRCHRHKKSSSHFRPRPECAPPQLPAMGRWYCPSSSDSPRRPLHGQKAERWSGSNDMSSSSPPNKPKRRPVCRHVPSRNSTLSLAIELGIQTSHK